jgi:hypothetical protein
MDGSSNTKAMKWGIMLTSLEGQDYTYEVCFGFPAVNNVLEYEVFWYD